MKKLVVLLILFVSLIIPQRAQTQNVNWVGLQSNTSTISAPGQLVTVMLNGSLNTPISGAALTLRYDPACFRVTSHHPGNLLTGAVIFAQAQPGQFDLIYHFQGSGQGQTGEGSLAAIQLEALKLCASDMSIAPNTISLRVWDAKGAVASLPGVEYRSLTVHLTPGIAPVATKASAPQTPQAHLQLPNTESTSLFFLLLALLPILGAIVYFLLLRRSQLSRKPVRAPSASPAKAFVKQKAEKKGV